MVPRLDRDIMQELGFADPYLNDEEQKRKGRESHRLETADGHPYITKTIPNVFKRVTKRKNDRRSP
jgi:hypothetical protein